MKILFLKQEEKELYTAWDEADKAKHLFWFLSRLKRLELLETVYVVEIDDTKVNRNFKFEDAYVRSLELQVVVGVRSLVGRNEVLGHNVFTCFSESELFGLTEFKELFAVEDILRVLGPYLVLRHWQKHELVSFGNALNFETFANYNVSIFGEHLQPPGCFRYLSSCRTLLKRDPFHQFVSYPVVTGIKTDGPNEVVLLYLFKIFFHLSEWRFDRESNSVFVVCNETGAKQFLGSLSEIISIKLNSFIIPELIRLFPMHLDLYNFDHLLGLYFTRAMGQLMLYPEVFLDFTPINVYDNKTGVLFSSLILGTETIRDPFGFR